MQQINKYGFQPTNNRVVLAVFCAVLWAVSVSGQSVHAGLLIKQVRIVDVEEGITGAPTDVLILGDRIIAIGTDIDAGNISVLRGEGRYLVPGLIDTHVHLSSLPEQMRADAMRRTLEGGVTRMRDMGGDGMMLRDLSSQSEEAVLQRNSEALLPAISYAAVVAGPSWMKNDNRAAASAGGGIPGSQPWLAAIERPEQAEQVAQDAAEFGVKGLKLYADLPADVVHALASAGRDHGLGVWSHATIFPEGPALPVAAGVDAISHAEMLFFAADDEIARHYHDASFDGRSVEDSTHPHVAQVLDQMAGAGTMLEPTLTVTQVRHARRLIDDDHLEATLNVVLEASRRGIPILAGTDLMYTPGEAFPNLHLELELLVNGAGLSPAAALRGATIHAAKLLGAESEFGVIVPGAIADLVLLESDPLEHIEATQTITTVIRGGLVVERVQ